MRLLVPEVRDLADDDLLDLYDEPGPYLRAGFVASLDGAIAVEGRAKGLQYPADLAVFRALRAVCDAVVVGAGTVRTEDYGPVKLRAEAKAWREANGRPRDIPLVVVSRTGGLGSGRVLEGPVIVARPASAGGAAVPEGVEEIPAEPAEMVAALHERGLTRLLCEGGPTLLTTLLDAGVVDELCLTTSPMLVGEGPRLVGALARPVDLALTHLVHDDPGVLLGRWSVVRSRRD
jgi:5-amino-6-(5-phosphoribosylamino)uracil reductase